MWPVFFIPHKFQSTPPVKAATKQIKLLLKLRRISIHAAREGGDAASGRGLAANLISIHAAREGGDTIHNNFTNCADHFNPRRP